MKSLMVRCSAKTTKGEQCKRWAIRGGTVCRVHGGAAPRAKARAAVRAEVLEWGLGDTKVDPGEVLLRLVSQSAARVQLYSRLLEEAYDAVERLKLEQPDELGEEVVTVQSSGHAVEDLQRIFNTGGVAALIGLTWSAVKDIGVYATGEAIRGLAELEAKERERCASFATKAVAAGLAERQVRVAERQGEIIATIIKAALNNPAAGLTPDQLNIVETSVAEQLVELAAGDSG